MKKVEGRGAGQETVSVTVAQWKPEFGNSKRNWKRMEKFSENCDSKIIVFPELYSSGYNFESREEIIPHSDTLEALSRLEEISAERGSLIVGGFPELDGRHLYDSAFAISDGRTSVYRKIHLWARERKIFDEGEEVLVVNYRGARIGVEVCYDLQFPELARLMLSEGADMIICPMAWAEEPNYRDRETPAFVHLAIAQSFSNGVFTAIANRVGTERGAVFEGHSGIADPFGNFTGLGRGDAELTLDIRLSDVEMARKPSDYNNLITDRRLSVSR
jgi:predicted amidohydrolase